MSVKIDLHMHTSASDGVLTPMQLLDLVRESGLYCFSVTDHDTIDGSDAISAALLDGDPKFITGAELSVDCFGADMHMLAYGFDATDKNLRTSLDSFQVMRKERGSKIVDRLKSLGVEIEHETVARIAGNSVVGRPHIAEALIEHRVVRTIEEGFRKYLGYDCPAYVPKSTWDPAVAIESVHQAGGITIMAHPGIAEMHKYIERLVPMGLDGIEVYHTNHSSSQSTQLRETAKRFGLLISGGTDFHGRPGRNFPLGMAGMTRELLGALLARIDDVQSVRKISVVSSVAYTSKGTLSR